MRRRGLLLAVQKTGNAAYYVVTRPNTGTSPYEMARTDLRDRYAPHAASWRRASADRAALSDEWTRAYEAAGLPGARSPRTVQLVLVRTAGALDLSKERTT